MELTGYFVRVLRDGRWINLDIASLTDIELEEYAATQSLLQARNWIVALAGWIRDNRRG
jgi:hypothetical protein